MSKSMIFIRYLLIVIITLSFGHLVYAQENSQTIPSYNRNEWRHWIDSDNDCQNLRQELLISQSRTEVTYTNSRKCTVSTGNWIGPYTGKIFNKSSDIDVDHVVPLAYAHMAGGYLWTKSQKEIFANDIENLILVDDGENQLKGAAGPSQYLPRESFRCDYLNIWGYIIKKYELQPLEKDQETINNYSNECNIANETQGLIDNDIEQL